MILHILRISKIKKNDKEDNWIVKEEMMIPTNYAKVIGKSIVELGKEFPDI